MLMFTLAILCLITSNLPWFMGLTFQVPMQYCSLQHQTLLPSPVTSTSGCCFCFGSFSSFFQEKAMAPYSSTLAWKIPWMEEPGGLQSMGSWRVGHNWLHFHFSLPCIGEGNGNPLQCSCLEIPGTGAWWAAIYGVAQSQTQLKWLSCSSSFILSGVISPLISSSILGTYQPGEFIFQCAIFLPFHTVHGILKTRILKWFAIPFSSGPHFVRTVHHDPSISGGPTGHGSQFHWVIQSCPQNSPGKKTGVDSHSLLQGIFPVHGSNSGLPHYRWILYHPSHQGGHIPYIRNMQIIPMPGVPLFLIKDSLSSVVNPQL